MQSTMGTGQDRVDYSNALREDPSLHQSTHFGVNPEYERRIRRQSHHPGYDNATDALTTPTPGRALNHGHSDVSAAAPTLKRAHGSVGEYDFSRPFLKRVNYDAGPAVMAPGPTAHLESTNGFGDSNTFYPGNDQSLARGFIAYRPHQGPDWADSQRYLAPNFTDPFAELDNNYQPTGAFGTASPLGQSTYMSGAQLANYMADPNATEPMFSPGQPLSPTSMPSMTNEQLLDFWNASNSNHGFPESQQNFDQSYSSLDQANSAIPLHGTTSPDRDLIEDVESLASNRDTDGGNATSVQNLVENIKSTKMSTKDREPTPKSMRTRLMPHQQVGLAWLLKMEQSNSKGGILADDMGLGKTVQALALILANPSKTPVMKTTLIVAPVALMQQWETEIQRHVKPQYQLTIYVYHGSGKNTDFAKLRKFDVVLTTFNTLASEFKQIDSRKESLLVDQERIDPNFRRKTKDKLGLLGPECKWYRVILDEAQYIRNYLTLASRASNDLVARYRLCMTGTPLMNNVSELYGLLRFLKNRPYQVLGRFRTDIEVPLKHDPDGSRKAMKRLQALLSTIMLRRCKDTVIDGEAICKVPPKKTNIDNVTFSKDEQELYRSLEEKSKIKFNRYLKKGTVTKNYASVLVTLLRLRQLCCHPHLINDLGVQSSTGGIPEDTLLIRARELNTDAIDRLRKAEAFECPVCFEVDTNPVILMPCGHTLCSECFEKMISPAEASEHDNNGRKFRCPHCRADLNSNIITDYGHFCKVHCPEKLPEEDTDFESENDEGYTTDDDDDLDGFIVPDDVDDDFTQTKRSAHKTNHGKRAKKPQKGRKMTFSELKKESSKNKAAKQKYLRRLRKTWVSSAKVDKTIELLYEIRRNDSTEKVLIFSQFTSLFDLLEIPLNDNGIKYQRYDGSLGKKERDAAVNKFRDDPRETVMLISLKAGNMGLNLSCASQVILLDPFWNPFVEHQAVDRAHRMPQERTVTVHRVLVPGTVEDRICKLQDQKRELINAALDENAGQKISRLGVQELQFLFGL